MSTLTTNRTPEQIADDAARQQRAQASWVAPEPDLGGTPGWREPEGGLGAYVIRVREGHGFVPPHGWCKCGRPLCTAAYLLAAIEQWRAVYEAKVQEFAAETLRSSELAAALAAASPQEGGGGLAATDEFTLSMTAYEMVNLREALRRVVGAEFPASRFNTGDWLAQLRHRLDAMASDYKPNPIDAAPPPAGEQVDREALRAKIASVMAGYPLSGYTSMPDLLADRLAPLLGSPGETDGQACALCGEDGEAANPLRWCVAVNGERMLAHGSCWTAPEMDAAAEEVRAALVARIDAEITAWRRADEALARSSERGPSLAQHLAGLLGSPGETP